MEQNTKDIIDAVSKIVGVPGALIAAFAAVNAIRKSNEDRKKSADKDREQRDHQLQQIKLQLKQIEQNRVINEGRLWLEFRKMVAEFTDVHLKLRPGGSAIEPWPNTAEEWARVEAYMGLFEFWLWMVKHDLMGIEEFKSRYGYRIDNILANERIVEEKLIKRKAGWRDFIELVELTGRKIPHR